MGVSANFSDCRFQSSSTTLGICLLAFISLEKVLKESTNGLGTVCLDISLDTIFKEVELSADIASLDTTLAKWIEMHSHMVAVCGRDGGDEEERFFTSYSTALRLSM